LKDKNILYFASVGYREQTIGFCTTGPTLNDLLVQQNSLYSEKKKLLQLWRSTAQRGISTFFLSKLTSQGIKSAQTSSKPS